MQPASELLCLAAFTVATALMWIPYVTARVLANGPIRAMRDPSLFSQSEPAWAQRAKRAHTNAVENLAVFASLVLIAAVLGVSTPATIVSAKIYLLARLVHYAVYVAGVPVVRTLAFLTGFAASLVFAWALIERVV